jgi:Protein of unknown function (DUF3108)
MCQGGVLDGCLRFCHDLAMTSPMTIRVRLPVAAALTAGLLMPLAVRAEPTTLRVEVYGLMGLHVLTLHSKVEETGDRYAITTDYATRGIAGVLVDLSTKAEVQGRLYNASARPISFRRDTKRNGEDRHDKVDYGPDGTVEGSSTPPPRSPVSPAAERGTVDNLTAYFLLERQLARTGSCTMAVPVFDGRYRYDLYFTDAGKKKLPSVAGQDFSGEAVGCHMRRVDRSTLAGPEQSEGASQGTIWYAKLVPGDAMVPVRMQMKAQIGVVDGYLAELHGRGVNLKFME